MSKDKKVEVDSFGGIRRLFPRNNRLNDFGDAIIAVYSVQRTLSGRDLSRIEQTSAGDAAGALTVFVMRKREVNSLRRD